MKEITLNNKEYKLIPIDKSDDIMFDNIEGRIMSFHKGYKKIGRISDILKDEDICHNLAYNELKSVGYVYLDWQQPDNEKRPYKFDKSTDSFLSYLKSIDLDITKQYLLIQKV